MKLSVLTATAATFLARPPASPQPAACNPQPGGLQLCSPQPARRGRWRKEGEILDRKLRSPQPGGWYAGPQLRSLEVGAAVRSPHPGGRGRPRQSLLEASVFPSICKYDLLRVGRGRLGLLHLKNQSGYIVAWWGAGVGKGESRRGGGRSGRAAGPGQGDGGAPEGGLVQLELLSSCLPCQQLTPGHMAGAAVAADCRASCSCWRTTWSDAVSGIYSHF